MSGSWITYIYLITISSLVASQQEMRPFIDQYREMMLSPLHHLPLKLCESQAEKRGHLFCCIRKCFRQPANLAMPRVLHDYYVDCRTDEVDCSLLTAGLHIASMELELDPKKELIPAERKKEMIARISPMQHAHRFAKWYVRLMISWIFQLLLSRGFNVVKALVRAYIAAGAP